ncbi:TPA: hypothetical protein BOS_19871 [Bos taurus]|nr:TPA: hypothetical protein BOS_19871 [Bos taurus]
MAPVPTGHLRRPFPLKVAIDTEGLDTFAETTGGKTGTTRRHPCPVALNTVPPATGQAGRTDGGTSRPNTVKKGLSVLRDVTATEASSMGERRRGYKYKASIAQPANLVLLPFAWRLPQTPPHPQELLSAAPACERLSLPGVEGGGERSPTERVTHPAAGHRRGPLETPSRGRANPPAQANARPRGTEQESRVLNSGPRPDGRGRRRIHRGRRRARRRAGRAVGYSPRGPRAPRAGPSRRRLGCRTAEEENVDTETQEEHHVIPEAEIGVILPQAKECQGSLASSRSQEKVVMNGRESWTIKKAEC